MKKKPVAPKPKARTQSVKVKEKPRLNHIPGSSPVLPVLYESGNTEDLYKVASNSLGRPPLYTPQQLYEKFIEYCEWNKANPLIEAKVDKGMIIGVPKMRAMSEKAFMLFSGISRRTWGYYKGNDKHETIDYSQYFDVTSFICDVIHTQKFEGAAADMLNPAIISRDLGLTEKKEINGRIITGDEVIEFE